MRYNIFYIIIFYTNYSPRIGLSDFQ